MVHLKYIKFVDEEGWSVAGVEAGSERGSAVARDISVQRDRGPEHLLAFPASIQFHLTLQR